jgi:hypothetical protein
MSARGFDRVTSVDFCSYLQTSPSVEIGDRNARRGVLVLLFMPWDRLSDAGNEFVVLFGSLLALICLFALSILGKDAIPGGRRRRSKRRRSR